MPTVTRENYLKTLYLLSERGQPVTVTQLSGQLEVSKPTVSHMVKSLSELGLVVYQKYRPIELTPKGRKAAAQVIRKHRLTELFLYEIMGFGWEEVHDIAEEVEHIDAEKLFARMDQMLNYPVFDPHGSPIPDPEGNITTQSLSPLSELVAGYQGTLTALANSSSDLLQYLDRCGLRLGSLITLTHVEPFDGSCTINYADKEAQIISKKLADCLLMAE